MDPGKDNEEKSQDPGAARFGNFINYYSFNPPENRLKFIPDSLISLLSSEETSQRSPVCVLDIGCNAGVSPSLESIIYYSNILGSKSPASRETEFPLKCRYARDRS